MIMADYNYNGKVVNFDDVFYAEDIERNKWELRFDVDLPAEASAQAGKIDGQIMIICIDIFGNEKREVLNIGKFKQK